MKRRRCKETLSNSRTVAVVGISPKEDRPSYVVASYLKSKGYRIIPVRPDGDEILGEKVYHRLTEIPKEIEVDVVDIFRRSEDVPPVVEEAIQRGAKVVWMQEGVIHKEAAGKGREGWIQGGHGPLHEERTPATSMKTKGMLRIRKCKVRNLHFEKPSVPLIQPSIFGTLTII